MTLKKLFKTFAFITQINKSEKGFTFISLLLAILLFTQVLFFISQIFPILQNKPNPDLTIFQFFHLLELEQMKSTKLLYQNQILLFNINDIEQVSISQFGTNIRRQVNQSGYEILLRNVEYYYLSPSPDETHIKIKIRVKGSKTYEKLFHINE
ncbi:competence type IV pilus minor pilin ComGF [Saliterribacillus persicus]|uniref:Competence protein ComGF n=1 Tax=Saliterribacillus persicus TaxID=930114 RepID=A0A368XBQ2_9BACI|nr:competence type IV pilus minor pilin ComGF [Saliterribacillus persicus]RCW65380.1 competence protein ComGF [Saliterribacillus persicus]